MLTQTCSSVQQQLMCMTLHSSRCQSHCTYPSTCRNNWAQVWTRPTVKENLAPHLLMGMIYWAAFVRLYILTAEFIILSLRRGNIEEFIYCLLQKPLGFLKLDSDVQGGSKCQVTSSFLINKLVSMCKHITHKYSHRKVTKAIEWVRIWSQGRILGCSFKDSAVRYRCTEPQPVAGSGFVTFVNKDLCGLLLGTCPCLRVGFARSARAFAGPGLLSSLWDPDGFKQAQLCLS